MSGLRLSWITLRLDYPRTVGHFFSIFESRADTRSPRDFTGSPPVYDKTSCQFGRSRIGYNWGLDSGNDTNIFGENSLILRQNGMSEVQFLK